MAETITKDRLIHDLKEIGVEKGDSLNLKISLKSIGHVEGGPRTVIEALMEVAGKKGTLVAESFVGAYPVSELRKKTIISEPDSPSYAGAIANAMIT
ncbi:MAG: aminoglycoside N(3)-acetyltransferase, partial [Bacteroidetes bacterium]